MTGAVTGRTKRFIWFGVMIALGVVVGLVYGWMINPVRYVDTGPDSLRSDYKADYVLMVAETYSADGNLPLAQFRLGRLGGSTPLRPVQEAILTAQQLEYNEQDMALLARLAEALQGAASASPGDPQ
jgi:hypothetical protein